MKKEGRENEMYVIEALAKIGQGIALIREGLSLAGPFFTTADGRRSFKAILEEAALNRTETLLHIILRKIFPGFGE